MDTLNKKDTRKRLRALRDNIPESERTAADKIICDRVLALIREKGFETVLCYVSVGSETGTKELITAALEQGLTAGVPLCEKASHKLTFHRISSLDDLRTGAYDIPEPAVNSPIERFDNAVCIVPGLGFTKDGGRIGYGGGYYDRFLAANDVFAVGICYTKQICGELPFDEYDRKMNLIITEGELDE